MFKTIVLLCSDRFRDERTDQAIYHIFQGKKSIQTIQDIYLYELEPYYRILPQLKNDFFRSTIHELVHEGNMKPSDDNEGSFTITDQGKKLLKDSTLPSIMDHLNGRTFSAIGDVFEKRLFLFVQVISNKRMNHNQYIPVIDDFLIMSDIKRLLTQLPTDDQAVAEKLYTELSDLFTDLDEPYPTLFTDRLTGYEHYGKSMQQLAREYTSKEIDLYLVWKSIIHFILRRVADDKERYQLLGRLAQTNEDASLTISAKQTKLLLIKGIPTDQIAQIRNVKMSTVYDHIVEIALEDPTFSIDPFINEQQLATVLQHADQLKTYQLRTLKQSLGDSYSYFQIRLALARGGRSS